MIRVLQKRDIDRVAEIWLECNRKAHAFIPGVTDSQEDDAGIDLIDFYVLPHYLTAPFKKVTEKIMTEFSNLNLCPINNRQGIVIDGEDSKVICKD